MKIKINYSFIILTIYFIVLGKASILACYLIALFIHEWAHIIVAKLCGYKINNIEIMPYGGESRVSLFLTKQDSLLIMLAGPISNLLLALFLVGIWWLEPHLYSYTYTFCYANIAIAVINLLPAYPLDGSKIIIALFNDKIKIIKILKIISFILGITFIILMFISVLFDFNISIGIFGVFLIISAFLSSEKEIENYINLNSIFNKNYEYGLEKILYLVSKNSTLYNLVLKLNPQSICEFHVVDDNENVLFCINETELSNLITENGMFCLLSDINFN